MNKEKAKPILFDERMARAIQKGEKVQTRRVAKLKNEKFTFRNMQGGFGKICALFDNADINNAFVGSNQKDYCYECVPLKYKVGDVLWVREPARVTYENGSKMKFKYLSDERTKEITIPDRFLNGDAMYQGKSRWIYTHQGVPNGCIKEMARTFLIVTEVKVERLQDISIEDIQAEGFDMDTLTKKYGDKELIEKTLSWWEKIWNRTAPAGYKWKNNPYVFKYSFCLIEQKPSG